MPFHFMRSITQTAALAALAVVGLASSPAAARTFEIATGDSYPPFVGTDLPAKGLATEVLRAALNVQGHSLDLTFLSWKRAFLRTAQGKTDGTYPYVPSEDRRQKALYSDTMFTVRGEVISPPDRPVAFNGDVTSLTDKVLCLPTGYSVAPSVMKLVESGRMDTVSPYGVEKCPQLMKAGRADIAVFNNFSWPAQFAQGGHDPEAFHVADTPVTENSLHYVVGKKHPKADKLIQIVNAGLATIRQNGSYERIVKRHMNPSS